MSHPYQTLHSFLKFVSFFLHMKLNQSKKKKERINERMKKHNVFSAKHCLQGVSNFSVSNYCFSLTCIFVHFWVTLAIWDAIQPKDAMFFQVQISFAQNFNCFCCRTYFSHHFLQQTPFVLCTVILKCRRDRHWKQYGHYVHCGYYSHDSGSTASSSD